MFSTLFRNQISTQNSIQAGKYFHKSVVEHEHISSSKKCYKKITCPADLQTFVWKIKQLKKNNSKEGFWANVSLWEKLCCTNAVQSKGRFYQEIPGFTYFLFMFLHLHSTSSTTPSLTLFPLSSGLSLGWNHTCASRTSRHTGETYAGWSMVRELCWISLAKQVVINRMTFGNNYQPFSLHPSFSTSPLLFLF